MKALESIINSKYIQLGQDGFTSFLKLEVGKISEKREKFVIKFCKEVFKVKYIDFGHSNDWWQFSSELPKDYEYLVKNCKGVPDNFIKKDTNIKYSNTKTINFDVKDIDFDAKDIDFNLDPSEFSDSDKSEDLLSEEELEEGEYEEIDNLYFPCTGEYSYILRIDDGLFHGQNSIDLLHEISHLMISGIYSKELDYGYNSYSDYSELTKNKANIIETLAGALTYVWGRFFGVIEDSNYGIITDYYGVDRKEAEKGFDILKKLGVIQEDNLPVIALFTNVYQHKDKMLSEI